MTTVENFNRKARATARLLSFLIKSLMRAKSLKKLSAVVVKHLVARAYSPAWSTNHITRHPLITVTCSISQTTMASWSSPALNLSAEHSRETPALFGILLHTVQGRSSPNRTHTLHPQWSERQPFQMKAVSIKHQICGNGLSKQTEPTPPILSCPRPVIML